MGDGERAQEPGARSGQSFTVHDRRKFTAEGERREGSGSDEAESPVPEPPRPAEGGADPGADGGFERRPLQEPAGVDLTMLVSAMAQQALRFLGEIPHPVTGEPEVDTEQARLQIDMLELLRVKCRGNMTAQEEALIDQALYQLRMLFVARTQRNP